MESEKRKRILSTMIVAVGLPLIAVGFYFTAYIMMSTRLGGGDNIAMCYKYQWQVELFKPAAFLESLVARRRVTSAKIIPYLN
jgi:hypothetical protein